MIYDIAIIGGGPAGYTAAAEAASAGLSTILFEKNALGGVCLNEGCVPTKALLYSAKVFDGAKQAAKYGVKTETPTFDLPKMIARKNKIIKKLTAGIRTKVAESGAEVVLGAASIQGKDSAGCYQIACNETVYQASHLLLCTGSETVIPPIPGLETCAYWTNREALQCKELPASLAVIGGGVIGMEFASFYNSLGCTVTVIEMAPEILGGMDQTLSEMLRANYTKRGITFRLNSRVTAINEQQITLETPTGTEQITAERTLLSVGRRPVLKGFGLETLQLTPARGGVEVNEYMQTSDPQVYACGDLTGRSLLAHTAVSEAEVAVHHLLNRHPYPMSYRAIPGVVYTNPEIASVGKTEEQLQAEQIAYTVKQLPMSYSGRFVAENEQENGVCKWLVSADDTLLGAHILGNPASELIVIAGLAIEKEMKASELKQIVFPHPTVGEILKESL